MSNQLETEVTETMSQFQRKAFIDVVSKKPTTTIQALHAFAKKYDLLEMTLGELMGNEAAPRRAKSGKKSKTNGVDVTTKAKRKVYDDTVYDVVKAVDGTYISAQQVRKAAGGTPLQVRKALNRLIEAGQLSFSGQARAMRYSLTE